MTYNYLLRKTTHPLLPQSQNQMLHILQSHPDNLALVKFELKINDMNYHNVT